MYALRSDAANNYAIQQSISVHNLLDYAKFALITSKFLIFPMFVDVKLTKKTFRTEFVDMFMSISV